ncbi:hypothetical protein MCBRY_001678 [Methylocystis bryophila]
MCSLVIFDRVTPRDREALWNRAIEKVETGFFAQMAL